MHLYDRRARAKWSGHSKTYASKNYNIQLINGRSKQLYDRRYTSLRSATTSLFLLTLSRIYFFKLRPCPVAPFYSWINISTITYHYIIQVSSLPFQWSAPPNIPSTNGVNREIFLLETVEYGYSPYIYSIGSTHLLRLQCTASLQVTQYISRHSQY